MKKGNSIYDLFLFHYVPLLMAEIPLRALHSRCLYKTRQPFPSFHSLSLSFLLFENFLQNTNSAEMEFRMCGKLSWPL